MQVYEKSLLKKIVSLTQIGKQANLSHFFFFREISFNSGLESCNYVRTMSPCGPGQLFTGKSLTLPSTVISNFISNWGRGEWKTPFQSGSSAAWMITRAYWFCLTENRSFFQAFFHFVDLWKLRRLKILAQNWFFSQPIGTISCFAYKWN